MDCRGFHRIHSSTCSKISSNDALLYYPRHSFGNPIPFAQQHGLYRIVTPHLTYQLGMHYNYYIL